MITELVKFQAKETTTDEQLISAAEQMINGFWKTQDGFIDAEFIKGIEENEWCFIYHNESMEKLKASGEKMRNSNEFTTLISLLIPETTVVRFYNQIQKW